MHSEWYIFLYGTVVNILNIGINNLDFKSIWLLFKNDICATIKKSAHLIFASTKHYNIALRM